MSLGLVLVPIHRACDLLPGDDANVVTWMAGGTYPYPCKGAEVKDLVELHGEKVWWQQDFNIELTKAREKEQTREMVFKAGSEYGARSLIGEGRVTRLVNEGIAKKHITLEDMTELMRRIAVSGLTSMAVTVMTRYVDVVARAKWFARHTFSGPVGAGHLLTGVLSQSDKSVEYLMKHFGTPRSLLRMLDGDTRWRSDRTLVSVNLSEEARSLLVSSVGVLSMHNMAMKAHGSPLRVKLMDAHLLLALMDRRNPMAEGTAASMQRIGWTFGEAFRTLTGMWPTMEMLERTSYVTQMNGGSSGKG